VNDIHRATFQRPPSGVVQRPGGQLGRAALLFVFFFSFLIFSLPRFSLVSFRPQGNQKIKQKNNQRRRDVNER